MSGINQTPGFTQAPIGGQMPRFLTSSPAAPAGGAPAYGQDQLSLVGGAGDPSVKDPGTIQQELMSQQPQVRYQGVIDATKLPPAQAIPLLAPAAQQQQDPQLAQLAQRAISVMQQMPGAAPGQQQPTQGYQQPGAQPGYQQPGAQPGYQQPGAQPGYQQQPTQTYQPAQQPTMPGVGYAPTQVGPMTYQAPQVAATNPQDVAFLMQTLTPDLAGGGPKAVAAIQQLAGIAQANPAMKDQVYNILLNHIYYKRDQSVTEAIRALSGMNDPRLLPYMEAVQRDPGYTDESHQAALAAVKSLSLNGGQGGPGTASVGGQGASPEYIRAMEVELQQGGTTGMAAFQQIRNALGADPHAASPAQQEVLRVMLTLISTKKDPSTVTAACQLLGQMGTRQMNTLMYLDAVKRDPGQSQQAQDAAAAAIQQIMATPGQ